MRLTNVEILFTLCLTLPALAGAQTRQIMPRDYPGVQSRIGGIFVTPVRGATGTVSEPPAEVTALSGPWDGNLTQQEESALGTHTVYWVWFDEPQLDAEGEGPYRAGSIWESALSRLWTV